MRILWIFISISNAHARVPHVSRTALKKSHHIQHLNVLEHALKRCRTLMLIVFFKDFTLFMPHPPRPLYSGCSYFHCIRYAKTSYFAILIDFHLSAMRRFPMRPIANSFAVPSLYIDIWFSMTSRIRFSMFFCIHELVLWIFYDRI